MGDPRKRRRPFVYMVPDITVGPRELMENDTNKTGGDSSGEPKQKTLLSVDTDDTELIKLTTQWTSSWKNYWDKKEKIVTEAENYWLGKQYKSIESEGTQRPIVDNLIFEALETFLPEATKRNAEAVVEADDSPAGIVIAEGVKKMLANTADKLLLRLKLKRQARYWAITTLGAIKVGWSPDSKRIFTDVIRTEKFVMDPDATIDDGGMYTGEYLGEKKSAIAEKLAEMFPEKKDEIEKKADGNMALEIKYCEWWTPEMLFFTMEDTVLDKYRNPHWNYDEQTVTYDETGQEVTETVTARNHLDRVDIPYIFLSVFNLGKHPMDDTSLIIQNLANQDIINQTHKQIVRNVKKMNGGSTFASESFTKEEAKEAQDALDAGDGVWVPTGDINSAFKQYNGTALPADVFNQLVDARSELRNIFGVKGSSAQGIASEQTVRGKIITSQKDSSRIGGGVSEYIEQVADRIFNWWVQLMVVYYTEVEYARDLGVAEGQEFTMALQEYTGEIKISVKEGSMLPQDELSKANQAVDLATAGFLSPIDLYKALDFPDPMETAKNLFLWQNMPQSLFPDIAPPMVPQGMVPEGPPVAGQAEMPFSTENPAGPLPPIPL
jgi:hypothetical protein